MTKTRSALAKTPAASETETYRGIYISNSSKMLKGSAFDLLFEVATCITTGFHTNSGNVDPLQR
ncbi:hypothetical protein AS026_38090 [Rhizobium altiplani]|uniref:Uncharacterized protein n=1 Tax=Rhizobium altiplani TaxID=1864509 RepID=A0A125Q8N7_9HYPH|nr:hypothetical protein AS026_38090 [Rhizobium altiplani]